MVLIDTSAWIEFLRDTGSTTCERVEVLLESDIATCDPVRMEVLAGARNERHLHDLRRLLAGAAVLRTEPLHYEHAASLFRLCRQEGETVRKSIDCLIAAVAIHFDVPILHNDSDFDALARHAGLKVVA